MKQIIGKQPSSQKKKAKQRPWPKHEQADKAWREDMRKSGDMRAKLRDMQEREDQDRVAARLAGYAKRGDVERVHSCVASLISDIARGRRSRNDWEAGRGRMAVVWIAAAGGRDARLAALCMKELRALAIPVTAVLEHAIRAAAQVDGAPDAIVLLASWGALRAQPLVDEDLARVERALMEGQMPESNTLGETGRGRRL